MKFFHLGKCFQNELQIHKEPEGIAHPIHPDCIVTKDAQKPPLHNKYPITKSVYNAQTPLVLRPDPASSNTSVARVRQ